jgi:ABC-type transport system involved in multi-copper enzyme maturation permease subunit
MFAAFFRFELHYWLRGFTVYLFLLITALMIFAATWSDDVVIGSRLENTYRNAPHVIQSFYTMIGLLCCAITTAFVNSAALRDFSCQTSGLIFCKPINRMAYLMGRFWGSTLIASIPPLGVSIGVITASIIPGNEVQRWGPFSAGAHVWGFLIFGFTNTVIIATVIFALATKFRSAVISFLGVLALMVVYGVSANLLTELDNQKLAALADPFGIRTFGLETRYWTVAEKNSQYIALSGMLIWNRLLWLSLSFMLMVLVYRRFSFAERPSGRLRQSNVEDSRVAKPIHTAPSRTVCHTGPAAVLFQFLSQIRVDLLGTIRSPVFIVIAVFTLLNTVAGLMLNANEGFGNRSLPVTYNVIDLIRGSMYFFLICIVTFFSGELVWRERESRVDEVFDALPHPAWIMYTAKLISLLMIVTGLLVISISTGIFTQAASGYTRFQIPLYLTELLGLDLFLMFCLIVTAMAAHVIASNRYRGYFFFIVFVIADNFVWIMLGIESRLVNFGSLPNYIYSDFYRFAPFRSGLLSFLVYWLLASILMSIASILYWQRGRETRILTRLKAAGQRWTGAIRAGSVCLLIAWGTVGAWIWYNTFHLNPFKTTAQEKDLAERYEKELRSRSERLSQPRITRVRYEIDLMPEQRALELRGRETLVNRSSTMQSELHLNTADGYETIIELDRGRLKEDLAELNYRIYSIDPPLEPGQSIELQYTVKYAPRGFENNVSNLEILQNGTFFNNLICPQIGYQTERELQDRNERRRRGLSEPRLMPPLEPDNLPARSNHYVSNSSDLVEVETIISTAPDQTAVAPGTLIRAWEDRGRNFFHYKIDHPSLNFYSFVSARYEVARDEWNGIRTEVYYHPEHSWNVPNMMRSIHKSLDYYTENFGPYRHRQARIIEFPRVARFAQAFPGTMPYSESIGFIEDIRDEDDIDAVFYVVAHEMAHQWWAHQVTGANMEGATLLSETLAQYSALMVMEREYGRDLMRRFLRYEMDNYLSARGLELLEERPLRRVEANQGYIHYNKGSVVMYSLKELIGEKKVNAALKTLVDRFAYRESPYPTSADLINALREQTPPQHHASLDDLFERITLFSNQTLSAVIKPMAQNRWQVTLDIECKKFVADGSGNETEVPFEQLIEVGAFAAPEDGEEYGAVLAREQRLLKSGLNTVVFETDSRPANAGVDPFLLLIDRVPADNLRQVTE